MKIFAKIKDALRRQPQIVKEVTFLQPVQATYEAARWSVDRSILPGYVQGARQDITSDVRLELLRRYRYFEKNSAFIQKILDLIETNTVGTGVPPCPASSSPEFNAAALVYWEQWQKSADIGSRQSYYTLQGQRARAAFGDGEVFQFHTFDQWGEPKVQLIESQRCVSSDLRRYRDEGYHCIDGVLVDQFGKPEHYIISNDCDAFDGKQPGTVTVIPADMVAHVFNPSRPGQYRGITNFHAILHVLHDLDDLQRYEMLAAKAASDKANVVTTENGEIPEENSPIGRSRSKVKPVTVTPENRQDELQKAFGGKTVALKPGEKWEQAKNERPSQSMRDFWACLEATACRGVGISYAAFCDYKGDWGGAALRGAVVSDARFFEVLSVIYSQPDEMAWVHVIGDAIRKGRLRNAPADWAKVVFHAPRRASVDLGRDVNAMLSELAAGTTNFRTIYGERGGDWKEELKQWNEEREFLAKLSKADAGESADKTEATDASASTSDSTDGTTADNKDAAANGEIQSAALNGAQVQALVDLSIKVASGELPVETAKAIAQSSFPLIPAKTLDAIFSGLKGFTPSPSKEVQV